MSRKLDPTEGAGGSSKLILRVTQAQRNDLRYMAVSRGDGATVSMVVRSMIEDGLAQFRLSHPMRPLAAKKPRRPKARRPVTA